MLDIDEAIYNVMHGKRMRVIFTPTVPYIPGPIYPTRGSFYACGGFVCGIGVFNNSNAMSVSVAWDNGLTGRYATEHLSKEKAENAQTLATETNIEHLW